MIKDEIQAKLISDLMLEIGKQLDTSVADIQNKVSEEEFNHYRQAVGKVMGAVFFDVMRPLYEEHPTLKPDGLG